MGGKKARASIAGPPQITAFHSTSFCCNIDKTLQEFNSYLYLLPMAKLVLLYGFPMMLSEDLL